MCNFVLYREEKLSGNIAAKRVQHFAGEEPYTEWEKEFEDYYGEDEFLVRSWELGARN